MQLDIHDRSPERLREAAAHFDQEGYLRLTGLEGGVVPAFEESLAQAIGIPRDALPPYLDPGAGAAIFDRDVRQRLSRIATSPALAEALLAELGDLIAALIGPVVHVSSTYHGQFKGGAISEANKDIAHYHNESAADYMEVHGAYRMHQDFTGASLPTSPSGITLWAALNDCPESTLRIFPRSHRLGMFCHKMWKADDPRLAHLAKDFEFEARRGTGVVFNALLFHGTGRVGAMRRVSCDLRFFPLTGFLPSEVHVLEADPIAALERRRETAPGPTVLSPILEQLTWLGKRIAVPDPPPLSILNWAAYVAALVHDGPDVALPFLERFVNTDLLEDPPTVFTQKFHNRQVHRDRLSALQARFAARGLA